MSDIQSLFFYVSCFMLASLMVYVGEKRKFKLLTILGLMIPIFIAGLRYNVGTDYTTYINNISLLKDASIQSYISDFSSYTEPTFYIFTKISYLFNFPQLVFLIYSTISVTFLYKAIKTSGIEHRSLAFFLILMMFPMSFNLMRQFAAISMAMYATTLLFKKHEKKYYLFTILAPLLHVSALINIVALIVYKRINDKNKHSISAYKFIFSIIMTSIVAVLSWYGLQKYGYLFDIKVVTANLNIIPRLLMLLVILTLWYSCRSTYRKYKLFIKLGILCILLGTVGFFIPYGDRIALYFLPFIMILFPTSIYSLMPGSKKYLTILAVVFVGLLYFTASYYIMGSHAIMPYRTILEIST